MPMDIELRQATEQRASSLERSMAGYIRHLIRQDLARASTHENGPAALTTPGAMTDTPQEGADDQQH